MQELTIKENVFRFDEMLSAQDDSFFWFKWYKCNAITIYSQPRLQFYWNICNKHIGNSYLLLLLLRVFSSSFNSRCLKQEEFKNSYFLKYCEWENNYIRISFLFNRERDGGPSLCTEWHELLVLGSTLIKTSACHYIRNR